MGDPDLPTPPHIVEALREAAADPWTHRYPSYYGMGELREAIAAFYGRRFGVELDPETEVLPLIGSKEGLAHLAFATLDPGDEALVPDPGYPVYATSTALAGATPRWFPLDQSGGFLPDLEALPVGPATKLIWLNYPSNPTAAVADGAFFTAAVAFAERHDLLIAHDAAYSEITFDGYVAPSALAAPAGKDRVIEFGSLSKTYNMTGWRVGYAVGNRSAVSALATLKTGLKHLYLDQDLLVPLKPPLGSIYVWVPVPSGHTAESFAGELLESAAVVVAPGTGYGPAGEGFVRISLTVADDRLAEAMTRIRSRLS